MKRYQSSYRSFSTRRKEKKARKNIILTAAIILFLIYSLLTWILPNLIGGINLLHKLKPQPSIAPLINQDETIAPPVLNIPYEATNTASIKIRGYASPGSKVEIYLDDEVKTTTTVKDDGSFATDSIDLSSGTNSIYGKTVNTSSSSEAKSLPSKTIKVTYSNQKPKLTLTSPSDGQVVKGGDKKVTVSGSTDPGDEITANGIRIIVNADGNFSQSININDGDTQIVVVARDSIGNDNQVSLKVTYQP